MGRRFSVAALLFAPFAFAVQAASAATVHAQTDPVYQEAGGIVVVEIESHPVAGSWTRETALAGFTGAAYYTWRGPDLFQSPGSGILRYRFNVSTAGTWHFRIHNRHDFADATEQNDCFTRMDGGTWVKTFSSTRGAWTWGTNHEFDAATKPPAQFTLSAGTHTLEFSGRSGGFSMDRFHLYRDGAANPLDTARPQSSTTTGTPAPPPPPPTSGSEVARLALINADTDAPVPGFESLGSGAVLNLGTLPTRNLSVQAVTNPETVGSIVFAYDGNAAYRIENGAPYAFSGDTSGNYNAWTPAVGNHSVGATPYGSAGGTGTAGTSRVVTFTVLDDPATPSTNGGATGTPATPAGPSGPRAADKSGNCGMGAVPALELRTGALLALALLVFGARRRP